MLSDIRFLFFFFFNDTATTEIYTLSYTTLFRSEPARIEREAARGGDVEELLERVDVGGGAVLRLDAEEARERDRKSTRLNSSHVEISYAVFCLKKKKNQHHCRRTILSAHDPTPP